MPFALVALLTFFAMAAGQGAEPRAASALPVVFGANTTGINDDTGQALDQLAARAGAMPKIVMYYRGWEEGWSTALINPKFTAPILARGATPMITWLPRLDAGDPIHQPAYSPSAIVSCTYDQYLERAAREAAAFGHPLFIRLAHEMNGSWSPWGAGVDGNTPADYIAMWRHVVSIFRANGATNVRWVWSPNVYSDSPLSATVPFQSFYPGDQWVDYVALDGYNWGSLNGSGWRSFSDVFGDSYDAITRLTSKPLMITETASTELGGDKAAWIRAIPDALQSRMPAVRALIWFDRDKETDWRIDSSPASAAAFRAIVQSPELSGSASGLQAASPKPTAATLSASRPPVLSIGNAVTKGSRSRRTRFTVRLSAPALEPVTVSYATRDGSAKAPRDFKAKSGVLRIGQGSTRTTVVVRVKKGRVHARRHRAFWVRLYGSCNATLGDRVARGRILAR